MRHSFGSTTKKSQVTPKEVDYSCAVCGKACIDLINIEASPFEDWSIQCDKCDKWYHLVCENLTSNENGVQPKSQKFFFCHSCKPQLRGKGHGKSSTVVSDIVSETVESAVTHEPEEINMSRGRARSRGRGCGHGRGHARGHGITTNPPGISDVESSNNPSSYKHRSSFGCIIKKKLFDD